MYEAVRFKADRRDLLKRLFVIHFQYTHIYYSKHEQSPGMLL